MVELNSQRASIEAELGDIGGLAERLGISEAQAEAVSALVRE
jgi:hypothetical protein